MSFSSFVRCSSTPRSRFWLFQFGAQELVDGNSRGSDNGELDQILVNLCEQNMRQMEHRLSKHISGIAGSIPWGRGSRGGRGFTWTRERSRFRRAYSARRSPSHQRLSTKQAGPRGSAGTDDLGQEETLVGLLSVSKLTSRRMPRISLSSPFW